MKLYLLLFSFLLLNCSYATNYYFSSSIGDDNRSSLQAQNSSTPWRSLTKLNSFFPSLKAGDSVLFKSGDTFYGTIIARSSGTISSPIIFSSYGAGNNPIITGLSNLGGWVTVATGIWESYNSLLRDRTNVLLLNEIPLELGRYPNSDAPNSGYLNFETHTNNSAITDNQLTATPNWTGAELLIRKSHWRMGRHLITNHSGNTINYTYLPSTGYSTSNPIDNFGYFIQNHRSTLDKFGEWYVNSSSKKIGVYFGSSSPINYTVQASTVDTLIYVHRQANIVFNNLSLKGANRNAFVVDSSDNIAIRNSSISFSGITGVQVTFSKKFTIENCNVTYSNNNGIKLQEQDDYASVRFNKIENTHIFAGMGMSGDGNGFGIFSNGKGNVIEGNRVLNTGYMGIFFQKDSVVIKNNFINNYCVVKDDGGGIYSFTGPDNTSYFGRKIIGNIVLNGIGAGRGTDDSTNSLAHGIFFDDHVTGVEVTDNTVGNVAANGIFYQYSRQITVTNNTVFNCGKQLFMSYGSTAKSPISGNNITNNIFFSKLPSQMITTLQSTQNDIDSFARFDSNYYCRPLEDDMALFSAYVNSAGKKTSDAYNLDRWKLKYKKDKMSVQSPVKYPAYKVNSVIGANKFVNGNFDNDINGIISYTSSNNCVKSYKTGVLDGGALQISFTPTSTGTSEATIVYTSIGSISSNKNYILRYSLKGSNDSVSMSVYLRQTNPPYKNLTAQQYRKIASTRTENEILISSPPDEADATIVFKIENQNVQYWLDNIQLYEADVTITNPDDNILFDYNASNNNKTISFNGNYIDVKSNSYSNSAVIKPFSSIILLKQGASKANQTITFAPIPTKAYGDAPFALNATASSGLPVSLRVVSGQATLSGNTLTLRYPSTVSIEASQAGNASYNPATPVTQSFTVTKGGQTITFPSIPDKNYGTAPFSISGWSSSGQPVTFRIVSGPATISGRTVILTGTGTVTIEASQTGNDYYFPAQTVSRSFKVQLAAARRSSDVSGQTQSSLFVTNTLAAPAITAHPNPFNEVSTITVYPAEAGSAKLEVYDLVGRRLLQLFKGTVDAGVPKKFILTADQLKSGTFVVRFTTASEVITQKIICTK